MPEAEARVGTRETGSEREKERENQWQRTLQTKTLTAASAMSTTNAENTQKMHNGHLNTLYAPS